MKRRPPRSTRPDTLLPSTTPFRSEAVRNGLRHAEHLYRYSFNHMGFDAVGKQVIRETQHTDRHVTRLRRPVVPAGCHPHLLGKLIREAMKGERSEEHTSELQSLMRISYAVFCLKKKIAHTHRTT